MINQKKPLGQHFLRDENAVREIVEAVHIEEADRILEIGPGDGVFTHVVTGYDKIYAEYCGIELDEQYLPILRNILQGKQNSAIIQDDILRFDIAAFRPTVIIGALPYYITSPILHALFGLQSRPKRLAIVIQKEVAQKVLSDVPDASYWTHIRLGYSVQKILDIPAKSFDPAPEVDSTALLFTRNDESTALLQTIGFRNWSKFLHHVFRNPRKKIKHQFSVDLLTIADIDPNLRAQHIPVEKLIVLYGVMHDRQEVIA